MVLPLKAHLGFAERHGARGTVYGVFQPTFSEEGVGTFVGFGGHFSCDFDLSSKQIAWSRRDPRTWGLGFYLDGGALSSLNDNDLIASKGNWIAALSLGALMRFQ